MKESVLPNADLVLEKKNDLSPTISEIIGGSVYIPKKPEATQKRTRVLLVEDDKKLSIALGIRLKSIGFDVCACRDATVAIKEIGEFNPSVVVIDINLPGGDGFLVAEEIKASSPGHNVPFVFITASKRQGLLEKAIEMGASGYLEKPFYSTELTDLIESCASGD